MFSCTVYKERYKDQTSLQDLFHLSTMIMLPNMVEDEQLEVIKNFRAGANCVCVVSQMFRLYDA